MLRPYDMLYKIYLICYISRFSLWNLSAFHTIWDSSAADDRVTLEIKRRLSSRRCD